MEESSNVRGTQAKIKMIQTNLSSSKKFLKFMEGQDLKIISKPPTTSISYYEVFVTQPMCYRLQTMSVRGSLLQGVEEMTMEKLAIADQLMDTNRR